mmetsp:Transcript_34453/g.77691  ORF Transcript_34453/g.77691 Transcript_34453/m.77691 type:complete len:126 (+) Transcript_34453:293-670(+)|eukprot:765525-Hanusia_phi.AAC.3
MPVESYGGFSNIASFENDALYRRFHSDVVETEKAESNFSRTKQKHWRSHFSGLLRKDKEAHGEVSLLSEKEDPDYRKDLIFITPAESPMSKSANDISLSDMAFSMDVGDEVMEFEGWTLSTDHYL